MPDRATGKQKIVFYHDAGVFLFSAINVKKKCPDQEFLLWFICCDLTSIPGLFNICNFQPLIW
jgi:hypothetical protein